MLEKTAEFSHKLLGVEPVYDPVVEGQAAAYPGPDHDLTIYLVSALVANKSTVGMFFLTEFLRI